MIVFLTLYVAVSAMIGDFYKMPIAVALTAASAWGIGVVMRGGLSDRIGVFSRAAGHSDILYMIWIFILAGAFASMAGEIGSVEATVSIALRSVPSAWWCRCCSSRHVSYHFQSELPSAQS